MIVVNTRYLREPIDRIRMHPRALVQVDCDDVRQAILEIHPKHEDDPLYARIADVLRRSGVEDAEELIRELEVRRANPVPMSASALRQVATQLDAIGATDQLEEIQEEINGLLRFQHPSDSAIAHVVAAAQEIAAQGPRRCTKWGECFRDEGHLGRCRNAGGVEFVEVADQDAPANGQIRCYRCHGAGGACSGCNGTGYQ